MRPFSKGCSRKLAQKSREDAACEKLDQMQPDSDSDFHWKPSLQWASVSWQVEGKHNVSSLGFNVQAGAKLFHKELQMSVFWGIQGQSTCMNYCQCPGKCYRDQAMDWIGKATHQTEAREETVGRAHSLLCPTTPVLCREMFWSQTDCWCPFSWVETGSLKLDHCLL